MSSSIQSDLSRSNKLIAVIGTLVVIGGAFALNRQSESEQAAQPVEDTQKSAALLIQGDADSPLDTIRRLKQNARKAADIAADTQAQFNQYKSATESQLQGMAKRLEVESTRTAKTLARDLGDVKAQLSNFMTLMEGRQQPVVRQEPKLTHDAWVEIAPINAMDGTLHNATFRPRGSVREGLAGAQHYTVNDGFLLSEQGPEGRSAAPPFTVNETGKVPVATIPENSPLLSSTTLSTLIGRIPKNGQVFEPYNFYILTGMDNWTSQLHQIPFLEKAIWRGVATGDKDLECVRGELISVTFVFTDGTVQTVTGSKDTPLAEIVTQTGSNCVPGTYVSNTAKYIALLGIGGGIAGQGEAIAKSETINNFTTSGNVISSIEGDAGNYFIGKSVSEGARQASRIIENEYNNSFASVVKASGVPINLMALQQIDIDYDLTGRKVSYVDPEDYQ